jgi:hypothetical protein
MRTAHRAQLDVPWLEAVDAIIDGYYQEETRTASTAKKAPPLPAQEGLPQ